MNRFEDLKIWKKAVELTKLSYMLVGELSKDEKYGLASQIKRSAVSISSNIEEGADRNSKKEFKHFLSISKGSCYELHTQLHLLIELNLLPESKVSPVIDLCVEIQKMNYGLQKSLTEVELNSPY